MRRSRSAAFQCLRQREVGGLGSRKWHRNLQKQWYSTLVLSSRFFQKVHGGAINSLDLDRAEDRYLLAGAADGSIAVYDTLASPGKADSVTDDPLSATPIAAATVNDDEMRPVFTISRNSPGGHRFTVSAVCWYPIDTGLFLSASYDESVRVWDTNTLEVVSSFSFPAKVTAAAMSRMATTHCLVAAGSMSPQVRLCDPASGAFSHTLSGHRDGVWSVAWSTRSEFELVTGDSYGQVRVWDIRRSGTIQTLDQYCTAPKDPQTSVVRPSSSKQKHSSSGRGSGSGKKMKGASSEGDAGRLPLWSGSCVDAPTGSGGLTDTAVRAHHGKVTSLLPSPDGVHWLSAGSDSRIRLWDAVSWHNKLTHYADAINKPPGHTRQLALSDDGRVLFHPCGPHVQVFDVASGQLLSTLSEGHYRPVNCCFINPITRELYSGGDDAQILTWKLRPFAGNADDEG